MHWWPRMMEMHSDALRCISNGLARNLMPRHPRLGHYWGCQNWYLQRRGFHISPKLISTRLNAFADARQNLVAMHLITFVKARFVAIHMAWVLNIFTQRSHYILLHILQNVSEAPAAHPNICWIYATYHRHLTPRETPCWSLKALHSQRKYFETVNPTGG